MKLIDVNKATALNYDDTYLVELKDGTHALGQLISVQKNHKTFKVINFNEPVIEGDKSKGDYASLITADVVKVAKLPKKGKEQVEEAKDPAV